VVVAVVVHATTSWRMSAIEAADLACLSLELPSHCCMDTHGVGVGKLTMGVLYLHLPLTCPATCAWMRRIAWWMVDLRRKCVMSSPSSR
jgi:hypothetical protein